MRLDDAHPLPNRHAQQNSGADRKRVVRSRVRSVGGAGCSRRPSSHVSAQTFVARSLSLEALTLHGVRLSRCTRSLAALLAAPRLCMLDLSTLRVEGHRSLCDDVASWPRTGATQQRLTSVRLERARWPATEADTNALLTALLARLPSSVVALSLRHTRLATLPAPALHQLQQCALLQHVDVSCTQVCAAGLLVALQHAPLVSLHAQGIDTHDGWNRVMAL